MYGNYTWVLWLKFTFLILSVLVYGFTFYCLWRAKLQNSFSGKLYLAMSISQLLIIFPNLLIPYFSNWNGDPHNTTIISEIPCMFQGIAIMFGWVTASFLSILDSIIVVRSLQGKEFNKQRQWQLIFGSYVLGGIVMIPIFLLGEIQVKQVGWDGDRIVYGFCNAGRMWMQYTFFGLDGVVFLLLIGLYVKIYTLTNQINKSTGIDCDKILIRVYNFSFCQIILWTTNLFCKFFLDFKYTVIEILSFIYYLEGVLMGYYFIKLYRTHLRFLPEWLTNLTRFGKQQHNKGDNLVLIYESLDVGSQSSSYYK